MAKEDSMSEITKGIAAKKVIIGAQVVVKNLKAGKLAKVFLASNCEQNSKDDIKHYGKLSDVPVVELSYPNDELGILCKKQFFISTIGILK